MSTKRSLIGSLEQTYAEASDCAALFRSAYMVYRPVEEKPDYFGIMPKGFYDRLKKSDVPGMGAVCNQILMATVVIVSPPSA